MIPHPDTAEPSSPADQAAEDALYYRRVLHELIDMGADLARTVHGQAMADDAGMAPELAVDFDRIARSVRRSIALARSLSEPVSPRAAHDDAARRTAARKRIIREVEDAIQREAGGADAEALGAELYERLDAPEQDDEIGDRPVAEVITEICRDLGLLTLLGNHPWKRRTPAEVATLWARAAKPPAAPVSFADIPPGELRWPPGAGACPGLVPSLAVVPPPRGPAIGDPSPGLAPGPTTPLLNAARFRGK